MSKDLQIIKELKGKFGGLRAYYSMFEEFDYKISNDKVIELRLSSKKLKNEDLELIGKLTGLKDLYLNNNQITKIEGLNNLVELEYLNLNDNQISKIQGLEKLANLKYLHLKNNQITKIQGLDKSTKLRWLNIEGNNIDTIQGLDNLKNLKNINFFDTNIPKKEIKQFKINNPEIFVFYNSKLTMALLDLIKQNKQK